MSSKAIQFAGNSESFDHQALTDGLWCARGGDPAPFRVQPIAVHYHIPLGQACVESVRVDGDTIYPLAEELFDSKEAAIGAILTFAKSA